MARKKRIDLSRKTNFSAAREGRRFVLCLHLETL